MEIRVLSRRCAGFKNVSMWMDGVLTWDGSEGAASNGSRRFIKAFRPQPKSSVFSDTKDAPAWSSESRESFKPYDVTKIDYVSEGAHVHISKKLLDLKIRHAGVGKENNGDAGNKHSPAENSVEKKTQPIDTHRAEDDADKAGSSLDEVHSIEMTVAEPAAERDHQNDPEPSPPCPEQRSAGELKSQPKLLMSPPALKKKPSPPLERTAEDQARRQKTRQLIKAKWEARRYAQASKEMSSSRQLSDTAVAFVLGRRPFATFADQTAARVKDSTRLSFNINPELYPNQPALVQTADSAVERAILKNGPQLIGCRQRIKMLQKAHVRNRLERRQESLARLCQSARGSANDGRSSAKSHQREQNPVRRAEGFFVKI